MSKSAVISELQPAVYPSRKVELIDDLLEGFSIVELSAGEILKWQNYTAVSEDPSEHEGERTGLLLHWALRGPDGGQVAAEEIMSWPMRVIAPLIERVMDINGFNEKKD